MQDNPRQRPHFPRILESRRRAQEQSNTGAPKTRGTPKTAMATIASAGETHDTGASDAHVEEQR